MDLTLQHNLLLLLLDFRGFKEYYSHPVAI